MVEILEPSSAPLRTYDTDRNVVLESYTAAELKLYRTLSNRVEDFGKLSKFWPGLSNPNGTINSAYGHLIWKDKSCGNPEFELSCCDPGRSSQDSDRVCQVPDFFRTPWEWAKHALSSDQDTRQAVLKFHKREHLWVGNKDQVCTLHGIFAIRGNRLNFSVVMRSNDLYLGTAFDWPWFMSLQEQMLKELVPKYPKLALGGYVHHAHSLHIYERNLTSVRKMLGEST
jgi:hypothetical protein